VSKELDELEEIARVATKKALENYIVPDEYKKNLVLGTQFAGDNRIFELYVPGETPGDALVIATATVDKNTKNVSVDVTKLQHRSM